ncbi:hypothetical protein N7492_008670 [Penicillium capsulatum]|uniref:Uncharacterized protein n=1 Tax=Penicillium capsulatum TaxID=69766 RepID=A0A9W9HRY2_9EURO|nr:hypothetical protein N7492_008670 [Penicillium capsulatum]
MPAKISIAIFRGDATQWSDCHAAIYVCYSNDEIHLLHLTNTHPFFDFTEESFAEAIIRPDLKALISVGIASMAIPETLIRVVCALVPIRNDFLHVNWSSQDWVCEALDKFVAVGILTDKERSKAIGFMRDYCRECRDGPG